MSRMTWRNGVVIAATIVVVGYCLGVIAHVSSSPDLGLHCTFSPIVARAFPEYLRGTDGEPTPDLVGCTIEEVGPYPIESWPQYLRVLRELQHHAHEPTAEPSLKDRDGERWVRVRLRRATDQPPFDVWCVLGHTPLESTVPAILWLVLELGMFSVGALGFWKRPEVPAAGPFFALSIVAVGAFLGGYHWSQVVTQPVLLIAFVFCGMLVPAVTLHFHHVFPRPKPWLDRFRWLTFTAIYAIPIVIAVSILFAAFSVRSINHHGGSAAEVHDALMVVRWFVFAAFGVAVLWFLAGTVCLIHSYFRADQPAERNQVKWILAGSLLALVPISYTLFLVAFHPREFAGGGAAWPMFAASCCITAAFTISITRYRLLRLDLLINSSMVYFLVSFLAGLLYYVLVFTGMLLVGRQVMAGPSLGQALWVSGSSLVLLVFLDLLRGRVKRSLEHRYRRDKHQLDRTLHQLSEAIEHLVEPPTLARHLLDAPAELLGVSRGALFQGQGDPPLYRLAGSRGPAPVLTELAPGCPLVDALQRRPFVSIQNAQSDAEGEQLEWLGAEIALALSHDGKLHGFLILGPKESGYYEDEDINLLKALAPIATLALQSAAGRGAIETLNRDLQAKVEKISEQQGRILALQRQLFRQEGQTTAPTPPTTVPVAYSDESEMVGSSVIVGQLLELVRKVAASPSAVLIRGESGTGKELLASAIHEFSPRAGKAFVKVHCASLSPTLLESELFGHVKGAFTGAVADKVGRFELAHGGTLFLDEIGDVTLDVQTKLLRVLQEKVIERVGSCESVRVDVRIVAATHQNLEALIRAERFREDLYYRLNVIPLTVPPLRERREDIPELVLHFARRFAAQFGKPVPEIDDDVLTAIQAHHWPGNVRELRNVVERAVVMAEGPTIALSDLSPEFLAGIPPESLASNGPEPTKEEKGSPRRTKSDKTERLQREREMLVRALAEKRGNKAEAARAVGMPRSTFLSKLQKHGLQ